MRLFIINDLISISEKTYNYGILGAELDKSKEVEFKKEVLGAFTDKAIADYIVQKYCKPTTTSEVLYAKENEIETLWLERETSKTCFVQAFDTEKAKAKIYKIPDAYDILCFDGHYTTIDQTKFIPGKTFEQIKNEMENAKQQEK